MKKDTKLNDMNKKLPFRVPDNYFGELPDRIMEKIQEEQKEKSKNTPIIYILKPAFSLAAMFIGFAIIAYLAVNMIEQPREKAFPDDIAKANYEKQYTSEEELLDAINQEEQQIQIKEETDEYIDYLLNEGDIDYGTLINELKEKEQDTSQK